MSKRFIIYGLLGFCGEVLWTGLGSMMRGDIKLTSTTYIWMFFIYGLAVFLEPIHDRMRHRSFIVRGGVYMFLIFSAEFLTGLLLKKLLGVCPWDYSKEPLSVYGLITLRFIPVWFFTGLIFERIHDFIIKIQYKLKRCN